MISPDASLTPSQLKAAELLTVGKIAKDVAKIVGVTPETISIWKRKPAFRALCQEMRLLALNNTIAEINSLNSLAENTLRDLMGPANPPAIRLRAALGVFSSPNCDLSF
ncbi:hypothetical protein [Dechloromonas sp. H13]|uniref:hypothetical protein n=1 Tax=Dechloromonas sp. H13 TaxID=2570193 RepID=UPI001290C8D4|nr:hypothetical protein [Dechloromonas sp. H13]